jgi:hypothetical protein
MTSTPRAHLTPRLLPILYFGAAHAALALAFGAVAWCLLAATLNDVSNVAGILRYAFLTPSSAPF